MKGKLTIGIVKSSLSVSSILYFKLIWIDQMQIITGSRIVQR